MRILIIGFTKVKYMPYMNFYLDNINADANDVHLLYWNRDMQMEDTSLLPRVSLHEFRFYQEDDVPKAKKLRYFYRFRKYAQKAIKSEHFDFIVILHSIPGVLLADILKKQYANKYIFDYRDSTYEGFLPFKRIVGDLVKFSYVTFVSSDAFRKFLPRSEKSKIYTSHNILLDSLNHRDEKEQSGVSSDRIRIAFWGFIRHEEINREIARKIAADLRFELHYYGREQQTAINLKKYVKEIHAQNIFFHGEYKPEDRYRFVRQTDIIHNIYYDNNTMLAMGNKYYDGIIFRIPQLCMTGSFMGKTAVAHGVGVECNPYCADFTEAIHKYYTLLDKNNFNEKCDAALLKILNEYSDGVKKIKEITGGDKDDVFCSNTSIQ